MKKIISIIIIIVISLSVVLPLSVVGAAADAENVTYLYSPAAGYTNYVIAYTRVNTSTFSYNIIWYGDTIFKDTTYYNVAGNNIYDRSYRRSICGNMYYSNSYSTINEAISAIKNENTTYTYLYQTGWSAYGEYYTSSFKAIPYLYANKTVYYSSNKTSTFVNGATSYNANYVTGSSSTEEVRIIGQSYGYTVSFESNGGSSISSVPDVTSLSLWDSINNNYLSDYIPEKTSKKFDGWYTNNNYTEKVIDLMIIDSNITLYAKWSDIIITFNQNGGSGVGDNGQEIYLDGMTLVDENYNYLSMYVPIKEGFLFDGWYYESTFENRVGALSLIDDTTLYAKWCKTVYIELNMANVMRYQYNITEIISSSMIYVTGSESIVRIMCGSYDDNSMYLQFYAVSLGASEVTFKDSENNEYRFIINVSEYGETIYVSKTLTIGEKLNFTLYLDNIDFSGMVYLGGDSSYVYVSSQKAGIPMNNESAPEGNYLYFYGLQRGFCIISFNGLNGFPPVQFLFTVVGEGRIYITEDNISTPNVEHPTQDYTEWQIENLNIENGLYDNFINLDNLEIPNDVNEFITKFSSYMNPLYTNGFVITAISLVGMIAFAGFLISGKARR